jgi:carboxypeptidase C (cathepsin A)
MNRNTLRISLVALVTCAWTLANSPHAQEPETVSTAHRIQMSGRALEYTARAGLIPIRNNEAGEVHGNVFFVSYALSRDSGQPPRPVTFLWNGGPGANSTLVHLTGFGPRQIRSTEDPASPTAVRSALEDNETTWLGATDLVFVDPVGTGFSRPTRAEYAAEFYSTLGDIASITEFVRVYLTRFDLLDVPVFLAGESYGAWRASGVAEGLEKRGLRVAGVMLISGGIQMGAVSPDAVRTALFVPSRTATAFYHHKLPPDLMRDGTATLKEVERWVQAEYAPAWQRRDTLTDTERKTILSQLARYTGVEPSAIDAKLLMMTSPQFRAELLRDQNVTLGRYDMRLKDRSAGTGEPASTAERNLLIARYLRNDLGFKTDLAYQGLEVGYSSTPQGRGASVGSRWVWNQGETNITAEQANADRARGQVSSTVGSGDGPPGGSQPWLRRAMTLDPSLRAFIAAGQYDSLNSCADNEYVVTHVEPQLRGNLTAACYAGGHMMYDTRAARVALARDIAAFIGAVRTSVGR